MKLRSEVKNERDYTALNLIEISSYKNKLKYNEKFLYRRGKKYFINGVTYVAFKPDEKGIEYPDVAKIRKDFQLMKSYGINSVRIPHTTPPLHLLDIAYENNLSVMVGPSAEQYIGYLIDNDKSFNIRAETKKN